MRGMVSWGQRQAGCASPALKVSLTLGPTGCPGCPGPLRVLTGGDVGPWAGKPRACLVLLGVSRGLQ